MALHTFGTTANNVLRAIQFVEVPAGIPFDNDLGNLNAVITPNSYFGVPGTAAFATPDSPGPAAIIFTATSTASQTLTAVALQAGAPISAIQPGQIVLSQFATPGTFVVSSTPTTVTLNQNAASAQTGGYFAIVPPAGGGSVEGLFRNGLLVYPGGRGTLKINRNDVVAVDNTGWPILVAASAVGYGGSQWTFT